MIENKNPESIFASYNRVFEVVPANTDKLREDVFRLRYQVYVEESGFEKAEDHPGGLERDAYDDHSRHALLIHRKSGLAVGAVRVVLPVPGQTDSLPIQTVCKDPAINDPDIFPVGCTGEASRFSISHITRSRKAIGSGKEFADPETQAMMPYITHGLIGAAVGIMAEEKLTHIAAVMKPSLLRVLGRVGIRFDPMGPLVEHHGKRRPAIVPVSRMLEGIRRENEGVWRIVTDNGRHAEAFARLDEEMGTYRRYNPGPEPKRLPSGPDTTVKPEFEPTADPVGPKSVPGVPGPK